MIKYYQHIKTKSIYKTEDISFSDGTPTLRVERWNWDQGNWSGHISDQPKIRAEIKEDTWVQEIDENLAIHLINYKDEVNED